MSISLIRALILYILVIFSVRLMGKRQLGELQPSELVITIEYCNSPPRRYRYTDDSRHYTDTHACLLRGHRFMARTASAEDS